jgi:hypothetical protein
VGITGRLRVESVGGNFVRLLWIAPVLCVVCVDLSLRILWYRVGRGGIVVRVTGRVL